MSTSRGARVGFWIVSVLGLVVLPVAWIWFGMAMSEAQSEQPKAVAAGTTEAGFGEVVGGVPLVLAHVVGLVALLLLGWFGYRGRGLPMAAVSLVVASLIGIGVAQLLWQGQLFQLGIDNDISVP